MQNGLVRLGDVAKTNTNSYSLKEEWEIVKYLDTGNITRNVIDDIQMITPGVDKLPSRARRKVENNSIVYSTVRPNQLHYGILKNPDKNLLVSTGFTVIDVDPELANPDYIYFALTQQDITETMQAIGEQSTSAYPSIKPGDLENLELNLPSIEIQNKIAALLSNIDNKMENNRKINNNLAA